MSAISSVRAECSKDVRSFYGPLGHFAATIFKRVAAIVFAVGLILAPAISSVIISGVWATGSETNGARGLSVILVCLTIFTLVASGNLYVIEDPFSRRAFSWMLSFVWLISFALVAGVTSPLGALLAAVVIVAIAAFTAPVVYHASLALAKRVDYKLDPLG